MLCCRMFRPALIFDCGQSFLHRSVMPDKQTFEMKLHKFKSLPFSRNPKSNLINIIKAKQIATDFISFAGRLDNIRQLDIKH